MNTVLESFFLMGLGDVLYMYDIYFGTKSYIAEREIFVRISHKLIKADFALTLFEK